MFTHRSVLASMTMGIVLVFAGCAGTSKKNTTVPSKTSDATTMVTARTTSISDGDPGKGLSQAQLVAHADPICKRLNLRLRAAKDEPKSKQDLARIAKRRATVENHALNELTQIVADRSIAAEWQQILANRRVLTEDLAQIATFAQANNTPDQNVAVNSAISSQRQMAATAKRMGFKDCVFVG
jgi:hypothetical protein